MADTFYIKQNDSSPAYETQLQDDAGNAVDITGFNKIEFHMWDPDDGSVVVNDDDAGNVSATDAANGKVKYDWQSGDTGTAGLYYAEWQVTYSDGTIETFPNDGNDEIRIESEGA
jgi:hypothetical protein